MEYDNVVCALWSILLVLSDSMDLIYERNLLPLKLTILQGTQQDRAVISLASRLGISRQQMRKILIHRCDMMTLENLSSRLEAAEASVVNDCIADALSLPHLTTATGLLSMEMANEFHLRGNSGIPMPTLIAEILEMIV